MVQKKREQALSLAGLVVAVLLLVVLFLFMQLQRRDQRVNQLNKTVLKLQNDKLLAGKAIDPQDFPSLSPAPTTAEKTGYDGEQFSFSYPKGWAISERTLANGDKDGVIVASQSSLFDVAAVPNSQAKITIRPTQMSWIGNIEQLAKSYTVSQRKYTINNNQVLELKNEDKSTNTKWTELYVVPSGNQSYFVMLTVLPGESEIGAAATTMILSSLTVK